MLTEWLLAILGSGGVGAAITYLLTFKSKAAIAKADATIAQTKAEHETLDLRQDRYDYLQETLDKYMRDYYALDERFRTEMNQVRDLISNITQNNAKTISEKCNEIAALKSQVAYLKGLRCYRSVCEQRIKDNPDK